MKRLFSVIIFLYAAALLAGVADDLLDGAKEGNLEKVRKAIELSLDKYCGVAAMLKKNSAVNYKLVIL